MAFPATAAYDAQRMRRRRRTKRWAGVDEVLGKVIHRVVPAQEIAGYAVWSFWDEVVGETLAARAQPTHFRNGTLLVKVSSHAWVQELQFLKAGLRDKLNARCGSAVIRDIQLDVGKVERPQAPRRPTPLPRGQAHIDLPPVGDDDLQQALARVVAARARRLQAQRQR